MVMKIFKEGYPLLKLFVFKMRRAKQKKKRVNHKLFYFPKYRKIKKD